MGFKNLPMKILTNKKSVSRFVFFSLCILALQLIYSNLFAQRVVATIQLELNALPDEKREKLSNFGQILEDYFNNYKWTNDEFMGEIPLNFQILLQDISVGYEDRYKLQILASNNSDIQYSDRRCRMEYQKGEVPIHNDNNWDSLTSLLDFFTYIIIGEEMDKFGHLLGTPYLEKAKIIAEQARYGMGQFIEGWDLRYELIQEILADKNKKFREMKDFYFYGLYFSQEDPKKARIYCKEAINMMDEILEENSKNEKLKKFIQAHHIEIVEMFKGTNNKEVLNKMIKLDPDREELYTNNI